MIPDDGERRFGDEVEQLVDGLALYAQPDLLTQAPAAIARCAPQ